ncbi:hypothetical protein ACWGLF_28750 [Streptomyces puniciscabiei]
MSIIMPPAHSLVSEEPKALRAKAASNDAFHHPALPPQGRWFDRRLIR